MTVLEIKDFCFLHGKTSMPHHNVSTCEAARRTGKTIQSPFQVIAQSLKNDRNSAR